MPIVCYFCANISLYLVTDTRSVSDNIVLLELRLLRLLITHNALQYLNILLQCRDFSAISGNSEQKNILLTMNILYISVSCCHERKSSSSILFPSKSQRRGISQRLVDKCCHLFICTSLK